MSIKLMRLVRVITRAAKCAVTMRAADGYSEVSPAFDINRGVPQATSSRESTL